MSDKQARMTRCPVCKKSTPWEGNRYRPFCCKRCSVIDLGNWADEKYYIKSEVLPLDKKKETE